MLPATFHPISRNDPEFRVFVYFVPPSTDHFSSAGRGQNQELQGQSCGATLEPQLRHKRPDPIIRKRRMALDFGDFIRPHQKMVEMSLPSRRILPAAISTHGRPIQYCLDPAAQPTPGFSLGAPNRLENLQKRVGINGGDPCLAL